MLSLETPETNLLTAVEDCLKYSDSIAEVAVLINRVVEYIEAVSNSDSSKEINKLSFKLKRANLAIKLQESIQLENDKKEFNESQKFYEEIYKKFNIKNIK